VEDKYDAACFHAPLDLVNFSLATAQAIKGIVFSEEA
jgi:hypothetical protein